MQNAIPIFCEIENKTFGLDINYLKIKLLKEQKQYNCTRFWLSSQGHTQDSRNVQPMEFT